MGSEEGGTEAFPNLGRHCNHSECNQLDFLPFRCQGCEKVFCLEHRSYKSHNCPKSDHNSRKVVVCDICSTSIERTGQNSQDEKLVLEKHVKSGNCNPSNKKKLTCSVRRCKEILTFSNTSVCKNCHLKVCLKHRFPADHACQKKPVQGGGDNKFLAAFASRNGDSCAKNVHSKSPQASKSSYPVKIF